MIINIFNGDIARNAWKKAGGESPAVAWRENYLEGYIPPLETSVEEFESVRAAELHKLMPELETGKFLKSLRIMDSTVLSAAAGDSIYLWFDACMFDQTMLSRILYLLKDSEAEIFLICVDAVIGRDPALFKLEKASATPLADGVRRLYISAWEAFSCGKNALEKLIGDPAIESAPFLAKALRRRIEDFPGADGLGRSERQLVEIIGSGVHDFAKIFFESGRREEHPFMGDTMCMRMLDSLVERNILAVSSTGSGRDYRLRSDDGGTA